MIFIKHDFRRRKIRSDRKPISRYRWFVRTTHARKHRHTYNHTHPRTQPRTQHKNTQPEKLTFCPERGMTPLPSRMMVFLNPIIVSLFCSSVRLSLLLTVREITYGDQEFSGHGPSERSYFFGPVVARRLCSLDLGVCPSPVSAL